MTHADAPRWIRSLTALLVASALAAVFPTAAVANPTSENEVCLEIDESRDMLTPPDRRAAIALVTLQFEREGAPLAPAGCPTSYALSHLRLGNTFVVTLSGANEKRQSTVSGMNELPALYSQMVRSIVTGRPMRGMEVTDRGNVTAAQSEPARVGAESFNYVRLGYGTIRTRGGPTLGFGRRFELDTMGIDLSFFNFQTSSDRITLGSFVKLQALRFANPVGNSTAYAGAGLSYGRTSGGRQDFSRIASRRWEGTGLSGEISVGYEFVRASSLRMFLQTDLTLPLYKAAFQQSSYMSGSFTTERRYLPAAAVSLGLGWGNSRASRR